jgi:hypothetical protein
MALLRQRPTAPLGGLRSGRGAAAAKGWRGAHSSVLAECRIAETSWTSSADASGSQGHCIINCRNGLAIPLACHSPLCPRLPSEGRSDPRSHSLSRRFRSAPGQTRLPEHAAIESGRSSSVHCRHTAYVLQQEYGLALTLNGTRCTFTLSPQRPRPPSHASPPDGRRVLAAHSALTARYRAL